MDPFKGTPTPLNQVELLKAIGALESKGVSVITGDCGFMRLGFLYN